MNKQFLLALLITGIHLAHALELPLELRDLPGLKELFPAWIEVPLDRKFHFKARIDYRVKPEARLSSRWGGNQDLEMTLEFKKATSQFSAYLVHYKGPFGSPISEVPFEVSTKGMNQIGRILNVKILKSKLLTAGLSPRLLEAWMQYTTQRFATPQVVGASIGHQWKKVVNVFGRNHEFQCQFTGWVRMGIRHYAQVKCASGDEQAKHQMKTTYLAYEFIRQDAFEIRSLIESETDLSYRNKSLGVQRQTLDFKIE